MISFQSYGVTPGLDHHEKREWYEAGTRIELLMNPADPDFDELQHRMYAFFGSTDETDKFSANPEFIEICQRILKREWEVLKAEVKAAGGH
jgi:DNA-binding ferritin-like protein (Dps family)